MGHTRRRTRTTTATRRQSTGASATVRSEGVHPSGTSPAHWAGRRPLGSARPDPDHPVLAADILSIQGKQARGHELHKLVDSTHSRA
ncbi:hypothetical protein GCM10022205_07300 [Spinactinospora alkalitolerans]